MLTQNEVTSLTVLLRNALSKLPTEHYLVMNTENIQISLPKGKKLEDCEGGFAVEIGKNLGVQWLLVGEVVRLESSLRVSLNLYNTAIGALNASDFTQAKRLIDLEKPLQKLALELFIKPYKNHPQGNPLADTDQAAIHTNNRGKGASKVSVESGQAGIQWVKVPAGRFKLSSNDERKGKKPGHFITVNSFLISETEITVGQYRKCVEARRCTMPDLSLYNEGTQENHPITHVNWIDARIFAEWVGGDLPTEVQWEYAARGGQPYVYSGSNDADKVGWYSYNTDSIKTVKSKKANGYGLYDMSGNVWEWVLDDYGLVDYGELEDGNARAEAQSRAEKLSNNDKCRYQAENDLYFEAKRMIRGGSWDNSAIDLRVAAHDSFDCLSDDNDLGFRVLKKLP